MEIVIRKPGKDLIKFLLDKAMEESLPVNVVRLTPDGLFLPLELADTAGLLDHIKTVPEVAVNDGAGRDAEPVKRATRKRTKPVEEKVPASEDLEDPWG